ncbi:MAG: methionyl-tRNA formyltransferase [Maricaulaceae bacterium]
MSLRIVFMGTPEFAVPSLSEIISAGYEVVRVYTQPPRRAGRGKSVTKSPVHQFAEIMGIPVETPESFRKPSVIDSLEAVGADVACVVAYGQILPVRALNAPKLGCLNLHASLLPRWRGAAPIQRAIMAGDSETGVQIQQMERGLDTGDIVMSATQPIHPHDTAQSLHDRLSQQGAQLWSPVLAALSRGGLTATPQTGEATYASKIDKSEARLDWSRSAQELDYHIRGLAPFPGAWCELGGKRVKIHMAKVEDASGSAGTVLDDNLLIACGNGALRLTDVQPAGKGKMNAEDFLRGTAVDVGTVLE